MMHSNQHITSAEYEPFQWLKAHLEAGVRNQCAPRDADLFLLRLERYFSDFYRPLQQIYGEREDFKQHLLTLGELLLTNYIARPEQLRQIDLERQMTPGWFQHECMLGYVCYTDLFADTLSTVMQHLDYLQELGITYLHLMPVLEPRHGMSDGGYAVQDYRAINYRLGSMDDLRMLTDALHARGISLCIDLVINHTAQEHEWAQQAMAGHQTYLDYYLTFDDRTLPDAYERTLREVFPDFAPGNFTWFPEMARKGKWVWTTFNAFQWDLNYRNPVVFREMVDIMCFLVNHGVDILRLDALPFIWKNMGTDCENQPEAHMLVQAFRAVMRVVAPGVLFKAEAIVPPDKLVPYLGTGSATGKACELAYHNQLMVLLWSTLATRKVTLMTHTLHQMPATPTGTTWLTYIRNHDDVGWAITDEYARAVGEDGFLHRQFLNQFYSGTYPGSFARGALFQYNPVTLDARISGSAASLVGLETALKTGDFYEIGLAIRRLLLLHSVIMVMGGIPLLYMGDELGLLNDMSFMADPDRMSDNRWMHRPRMDWQKARERYDRASVTGRIFAGIRHLARTRAATPALRGDGITQPMWTDNQHVFALARQHTHGNLLLLANFHEQTQGVAADIVGYAQVQGEERNALDTRTSCNLVRDGRILLEPYESVWLVGE